MICSIQNRVGKTYGSSFPLFRTNQLQRLNYSPDFKDSEYETLRQTFLFSDLKEALAWKPNTFYGIRSPRKTGNLREEETLQENVEI